MKYTYSIRLADRDDAPAIAQIQASLWRQTYEGRMPDALIERMEDTSERTRAWQAVFKRFEESGLGRAYVAEAEGFGVVGFGTCGPQRENALRDAGYGGEVTTLYIAAPHQRSGVGSAIMRSLLADLDRDGFKGAALWTLDGNPPAEAIWRSLGAEVCASRRSDEGDVSETAFGWLDLSAPIH